jgi:hypothetical protein
MTKRRGLVVGEARLLEGRAVAGGEGGCWREERLLKERAVAEGKRGCWREARLLEERACAEGSGTLFHQQLPSPFTADLLTI